MGRKNIFDIMNEKNDVDYQIKKIDDLLSEMSVDDGTLEDIIDEYCICLLYTSPSPRDS